MTLSLLLFGASGQVGREIARRAGPALTVLAHDRASADLTEPERCARLIAEAECDAVINAAAYTAVDRAEQEPELAHLINAEAPGAMARAAAARGLPFLHISTDYVFDGSGARPWREEDPPAPLGAYGRSKLEGERAVAAAGGPHATLRTAWVFSEHGGNFVKTMLRVGATRDKLTVVDDQIGGPTPASAIAEAMIALAAAFQDGRTPPPLLHFCGAPIVSWRGFAEEIFARSGWRKTPEIAPISSSDWPTPAARPANSALDCSRAAAFGLPQPDWRAGLDAVLTALTQTESKEAQP